jgi:small subunit ribosomal protein S1
MKDFFREENGEIVPVDESVLIDFKDGDIVEGDVVRIDRDEVLVDIGYKSEGLIPSNELTIRKGADPHDVVELGQHLEALVMQKEDADGRRGPGHRGREGRPDPGHRAARFPAREPR